MTLPFVSIIIVNFNGLKYLRECLDSVESLNYPRERFEVILVDNASTDGSVGFLKDNFPRVKTVSNSKNLGFAGGNNTGIRESRGEFVVLLNNDTVVDRDWLVEFVNVALHDDRVGIATSKIMFKNRPNVINNAGSRVLPNGWGSDRGFGEEDHGQYDRVEEVFCACGASMLLRRKMLDEVGSLDPDFFCYYEDTDLSWRARLRGWKVVYTYKSLVYHVHTGTATEWSPFFTFYVLRNRHFMLFKNAPFGMFYRSLKDSVRNTLVESLLHGRERRRTSGNPNYYSLWIRTKVYVSFLKNMPGLLVKRARIRGGMAVSDEAIMSWIKQEV